MQKRATLTYSGWGLIIALLGFIAFYLQPSRALTKPHRSTAQASLPQLHSVQLESEYYWFGLSDAWKMTLDQHLKPQDAIFYGCDQSALSIQILDTGATTNSTPNKIRAIQQLLQHEAELVQFETAIRFIQGHPAIQTSATLRRHGIEFLRKAVLLLRPNQPSIELMATGPVADAGCLEDGLTQAASTFSL